MAKMEVLELVTPPGDARFVQLNDADFKYDTDGRYKVDLRMEEPKAGPFMDKVIEYFNNQFEIWKAQPENKKKPRKVSGYPWDNPALDWNPDGGDVNEDGDPMGEAVEVPGFVDLKFRMRALVKPKGRTPFEVRPQLKDYSGADLDPKEIRIGAGSVLQIGVVCFSYYIGGADGRGFGVSMRPGVVRVLRHVPPGRGRDYDFDEYDVSEFDPSKFDEEGGGETTGFTT